LILRDLINVRTAMFGVGLLLGACGSGEDCSVAGDPASAPEAGALFTDGSSRAWLELTAGMELPLLRPPQGGFVAFVGMRARNVSACRAEVSGRFLDATTREELAIDKAGLTTTHLIKGSDGWLRPDAASISAFPNIAPCPNFKPAPVEGVTVLLDLSLIDLGGRRAALEIPVVPTCAPGVDEEICRCQCQPSFMLGRCPR
jgi:hypothetical protein